MARVMAGSTHAKSLLVRQLMANGPLYTVMATLRFEFSWLMPLEDSLLERRYLPYLVLLLMVPVLLKLLWWAFMGF